MALKSTIFKADLEIADIERNYYASHSFTIARHPSETDERMMLRVLAFALNAGEGVTFGKGLSTDDEPDLWQRDLTGRILLWIDVGQPDERLVRRASGRADEVVVYTYGRGADLWWNRSRAALDRVRNLTVKSVTATASQNLAKLAQRTMQLSCTIQDGHIWLGDPGGAVEVVLTTVKGRSDAPR